MTASLSACVGLSLAFFSAMAQPVSAEELFNADTSKLDALSAEPRSPLPSPDAPLNLAPAEDASLSQAASVSGDVSTETPQAELATLADSCVAGCNPNASFVFRPPSQAIAPGVLGSAQESAAENAVPHAVPHAVPNAVSNVSPRAVPNAVPMAIAKPNRGFGLVQISNPPLPIATPAPNSDYQAPFPPPPSQPLAPAQAAPVQAAPAQAAPSSPILVQPAARTALTPPTLRIQGVYIYEGGESAARARFSGVYPLTRNVQVGGAIDITTGSFSENNEDGVSINELYLATSLDGLPNLRFVVGQLDLTSYFDRNSFAKDRASQFFNPVFQTNPALVASGIGSRPGALLNWSVTDNLEARAAVFSSDRSISDFSLDGFAGEVGLRLGDNFIIRGTYATGRDGGSGTSFREVGQVRRGNDFGLREGDREESYGVNAELFIPSLSLGLFGRYGRYDNQEIDLGGDTYVFGLTFLDLFMLNDRLGLGYGRELSNDRLRRDAGNGLSDAAEIFYDFEAFPNLRLGLTFQALDGFSETIAGVRVRTEFDLLPRRTP
ncbi:MAG: porin [Oscillatoriophycideae cyanobacterium NC_groundwater_1537_Pr4_S-0.65um_50_18]|nr:porin [Oscillatoriophycideae cyanobacterium NC_groundwater_1537_Pr4_S-0.65um_50_18]